MRCISCGAEMDVVRVDRDDTTLVPGYERQTSQCSTCKEVEQRLVFRRRKWVASDQVRDGSFTRHIDPG